RWVKGFTFGEIIGQNDGHYYTQVLNRNAHSWVEVFFPDIGWVPFEPTPSFSNPFSFQLEQDEPASSSYEDQQEQEEKVNEEQKEDVANEEYEEQQQSELPNLFSSLNGELSKRAGWKIMAWLAVGCLLLLSALYFWRYTLLSWLITRYK